MSLLNFDNCVIQLVRLTSRNVYVGSAGLRNVFLHLNFLRRYFFNRD